MFSFPSLIVDAILLLIISALIVEIIYRRRMFRKESEQNKRKQQQFLELSQESKTLKKELSRKGEITDQIPLITQKLTEKLPLSSFPAIAVRSAKDFFRASQVGFFVPLGFPDYTLKVGVGFSPDWEGKIRIKSDEGILGMALQKKVVVARTDLLSSAGRRLSQRSLEQLGINPDFVAPVFGISGIIGALVIAGCPFPLDEERKYVSMLADLLSAALRNAAMVESSKSSTWVDHLTGVSNRLYLAQRFESEIRRAENYYQPLALFMIDIDEFKKINDTYGHSAGDVVLKKIAEIIRKNTRSSDLVSRFGGDEFVVLMTSSNQEQALTCANHVREKIDATEISIPGHDTPVRITISGGLAVYPTNGKSTTELFRAADDAMYESKRQGRNRILIAASVGLDNGIARGTDEDRETPILTDISVDTGSDAVEFPLGKIGENING